MKYLVRKGEELEERHSIIRSKWKEEDFEKEREKMRKVKSSMFLECDINRKPVEPRKEIDPKNLVHFGSDIIEKGYSLVRRAENMERLGVDYILLPSGFENVESGQSGKLLGVFTAYFIK